MCLQVGAHGTGAQIPPMDEQVVALTLVTPGRGTLRLSAEDADPSLFYLARVGLGALGVVAEVTLQAVPAHRLLEHTYVSDLKVQHRTRSGTATSIKFEPISDTTSTARGAWDSGTSGRSHAAGAGETLNTKP